MIKKRLSAHPEIKNDVTPLYISAFPVNERPPVINFYRSLMEHEENELYAYYEENRFIGFTYITAYKDIVYIFFLAVQKEERRKGFGTLILQDIKNTYPTEVLLVCYEEVDPSYIDYEERLRREKFYERNGFKRNIFKSKEYGVVFQSAYIGSRPVTFEEYRKVFELGFGTFSLRFLKEA